MLALEPVVVDAVWLHADRKRSLSHCASDPDRLALIQEAYEWAEQTPWALAGPASTTRARSACASRRSSQARSVRA